MVTTFSSFLERASRLVTRFVTLTASVIFMPAISRSSKAKGRTGVGGSSG